MAHVFHEDTEKAGLRCTGDNRGLFPHSTHWTSREHRRDPTLCGSDWVPTWMETWLLGYCAQPQVPIPTKGSSVEHHLPTTAPYASAWCPDLATDTQHALRMGQRHQLLTATATPTPLSRRHLPPGICCFEKSFCPRPLNLGQDISQVST